ncbi:MAG: tripartite tricarboxylate transporter substrate binding protein [Burkholderiaceae bacterium]
MAERTSPESSTGNKDQGGHDETLFSRGPDAALAGGTCRAAARIGAEVPRAPIRVTVPFPPGGASDILARSFFSGFEQKIGQPVVIENKAGAAALIGTKAVASAAPDGYTLGFFDVAYAINPALREKDMPYKQAELKPLLYVAEAAQVFVTSAASGIKTVPDALAALKGSDKKRSFSSAGVGSGSHLAAEQLTQVLKVSYLHVPYKGGAPSNAAIAGGEVDFTFATASAIRAFVDAGKAVPLAVASTRRVPMFPNVPTLAEAGVRGAEAAVFFGVFAPAGVPDAITAKLTDAMVTHLNTPEVRERLVKAGFDIDGRSGGAFASFISGEVDRWGKVVRAGNIKPE